ncbi:hypothetical protein RJG79_00790 [Mycoplasmatota bacterium WC44]
MKLNLRGSVKILYFLLLLVIIMSGCSTARSRRFQRRWNTSTPEPPIQDYTEDNVVYYEAPTGKGSANYIMVETYKDYILYKIEGDDWTCFDIPLEIYEDDDVVILEGGCPREYIIAYENSPYEGRFLFSKGLITLDDLKKLGYPMIEQKK